MADSRFPFFTQPFALNSGNGLNENILITSSQHSILTTPFTDSYTTLNNFYDWHHDPSQPLSFTAYSPSTKIGFAEMMGRRDQAEDRIAFGVMVEFEYLSEEQRITVLQNTIARLANLASVYDMAMVGSTLCLTVCCKNKIYTVNVGDSTAHLFSINQSNSSCIRLNPILHHPNEPSEKIRLSKNPQATIVNNRLLFSHANLKRYLAVSRAIGDTAMTAVGLIPSPDICITTLSEYSSNILMVACDGLTENDCLVTDNNEMIAKNRISIQSLIEENYNNSTQQIAAALCMQAYDANSSDNISVIAEKIDMNASTTYMAMFDGHGGVQCADLLRRNFFTVFQDEVFRLLPKNIVPLQLY